MQSQIYKLTPAAWKAARRRTLIAVPVLLLAFSLLYVAWYFNPSRPPLDHTKVITAGCLVAVFLPISLLRMLKRQKTAYENFVIEIDNDRITGHSLMRQPIDLAFIEITQIVKQTDGSYVLLSGPGNMAINIPGDIENKEQLEIALNHITAITVNPVNWFTRHLKLVFGAAFGLIVLFIYSRSKIIIGISSPILVAMFLWLYLNMRTADGVKMRTPKQKVVFALIITGILVKAFLVLTGRY